MNQSKAKMKHNHLFKQIGSGCLMVETKDLPCDAHYRCECGVEFKLKTDRIGHRFLPVQFWQEALEDEVKKAELAAIADIDLGLNSPLN